MKSQNSGLVCNAKIIQNSKTVTILVQYSSGACSASRSYKSVTEYRMSNIYKCKNGST